MRERNYNIDGLKAFAIISVILLHTLPWEERFLIGAPFHIWQAVPIFMLLVGYNFAKSSIIKEQTSLIEVYQWPIIKKRLLKIFVPFLVIVIIRFMIKFFIGEQMNWQLFFTGLFIGDFEHGGYFIPVMIQTIIIVPLLYIILRQNLKRNTILLLIFSYALDWIVMLLDISGSFYRISVIRYLFVIVLGLWLGMKTDKIDYRKLLFLACGSFIYISSVYYLELETTLETYWQAQHGPAYFWTLLIVIIFLYFINIKPGNIFSNSIIKIGQASYHIFLVQMIFFWIIGLNTYMINLGLEVVLNLLVCNALGILFYKLDK